MSTALPPQQHATPVTLDVEPRRQHRTHAVSSEDEAHFSSPASDSDGDLPQQPKSDELLVGETVESDTGDPHDSFPSEDLLSYSQML